jgi:hypothetical protein
LARQTRQHRRWAADGASYGERKSTRLVEGDRGIGSRPGDGRDQALSAMAMLGSPEMRGLARRSSEVVVH